MSPFDVIVIGCGAMGSAALAEIARRGQRVLGLEQFDLMHDQGSSHGGTRIIRLAYFEHPDYVPLLRRAFARWYELEQLSGQSLLTECGVLNIGLPDSEVIQGVRHSVAKHQLQVQEYTAPELMLRWPHFTLPEPYVGLFEKVAGFLRVEACVRAHLQVAQQHGAQVLSHQTVLGWENIGQSIRVTTTHGSFETARLIVTAGAWSRALLQQWQLPLTVMRQVACWFRPNQAAAYSRQQFPCYLVSTPSGEYYGFPMIDAQGCKLARHYGAPELPGPQFVDRTVQATDEAPLRRFAEQHLPGINGAFQASSVCLYTLTPDRHFVIDQSPTDPRVVVATGFSGHGFKFASVVGEILADLATLGNTTLPIELFRAARFAH